MKITYWFLLPALLATAPALQAEQDSQTSEEVRANGLSDSEIKDFLEKKAEYKNDPEALATMNALQKAMGITEADIARVKDQTTAADDSPSPPRIDANAEVAEQAYLAGDYETALQHYQALAAQGDGYANLMLGLMYHQGQGVDKDISQARAYYDRAGDYGEERGAELSESLDHKMSESQQQQARQDYADLVKKQQQADAPASAGDGAD